MTTAQVLHRVMTMSAVAAKALVLLWAAGVLYEYRSMAWPHPGWLFHLHTVFASAFVVALVWGTASSIAGTRHYKGDERQKALKSHKLAMLAVGALSAVTASLMLVKKAIWNELGWLLISGRMPSYHSWTALLWTALEGTLILTGLVIFAGDGGPPKWLKSMAEGWYGRLGSARSALKPSHRAADDAERE